MKARQTSERKEEYIGPRILRSKKGISVPLKIKRKMKSWVQRGDVTVERNQAVHSRPVLFKL